jgi:type IV pilus assembly protein PilA
MKKVQSGFTLIELMIVVAIIGILAAVAIPAYREYVQESHGAAAMKAVGGFIAKAQTCTGTGKGCATLTTELGALDGFSGSMADGVGGTIVFTGDQCIVTATVSAGGQVTYAATATAAGDATLCASGAGL